MIHLIDFQNTFLALKKLLFFKLVSILHTVIFEHCGITAW